MTDFHQDSSMNLSPDLGKKLAVALFEPDIPLNVGSIARTCACTGVPLHLIGRLGFRIDDRLAKRAGLDYWELVEHHEHRTWEEFIETVGNIRPRLFSTKGKLVYTEVDYMEGDILVFGPETSGLPDSLLDRYRENVLTIPMIQNRRSLNLSNAVAIVLYAALMQLTE